MSSPDVTIPPPCRGAERPAHGHWRFGLADTLLVLLLFLAAFQARAAEDGFEALVDPTRPLTGPVEAQGNGAAQAPVDVFHDYEVNSILIRPDLQLAVVNSQRVAVGDEVDGATVLAIEPGQVLLEMNGETREAKLHPRSIKTPVEESAGDDVLE